MTRYFGFRYVERFTVHAEPKFYRMAVWLKSTCLNEGVQQLINSFLDSLNGEQSDWIGLN